MTGGQYRLIRPGHDPIQFANRDALVTHLGTISPYDMQGARLLTRTVYENGSTSPWHEHEPEITA